MLRINQPQNSNSGLIDLNSLVYGGGTPLVGNQPQNQLSATPAWYRPQNQTPQNNVVAILAGAIQQLVQVLENLFKNLQQVMGICSNNGVASPTDSALSGSCFTPSSYAQSSQSKSEGSSFLSTISKWGKTIWDVGKPLITSIFGGKEAAQATTEVASDVCTTTLKDQASSSTSSFFGSIGDAIKSGWSSLTSFLGF